MVSERETAASVRFYNKIIPTTHYTTLLFAS